MGTIHRLGQQVASLALVAIPVPTKVSCHSCVLLVPMPAMLASPAPAVPLVTCVLTVEWYRP